MSSADCFRNAVTASGLGVGLGFAADVVTILRLLLDDANTTLSLRLPLEDVDDVLRYGMISLGNTSFRASLVLGPPDAAQNWIRVSKSDAPTIDDGTAG